MYKEFEQKAKDKIRDMENRLEQTTFDRENYKAQLSGNDGRISALESQLARVEAMKNDTEFKLSSLYSILRRSLGLRSGSQSSFSEEESPKKNRRSFRGRSRSNSGIGTSIFCSLFIYEILNVVSHNVHLTFCRKERID